MCNSFLKPCNSVSFCSSKSCAVLCPVKTLPDKWIVVSKCSFRYFCKVSIEVSTFFMCNMLCVMVVESCGLRMWFSLRTNPALETSFTDFSFANCSLIFFYRLLFVVLPSRFFMECFLKGLLVSTKITNP